MRAGAKGNTRSTHRFRAAFEGAENGAVRWDFQSRSRRDGLFLPTTAKNIEILGILA
jgi:hypothetical protein